MFDPTADVIFADGPTSNPVQPQKSLIRKYFRQFENAVGAGLSNGGLIYDTKASLNGDLAHGANSSAWVIGDSTAANNGIYRKSGASGSGSWIRIADLPYSVIRATNAGAGTADAIQAATDIPIPAADGAALISLPIVATNTSSAPTVQFNGGTVLTITDSEGNVYGAGSIGAGTYAGYVVGSTFRIVTGTRGWSPAFAVVSDGARRVLKVADWVGGQGAKPATGYVGSAGIVAAIGDAVDIRGTPGPTGPGTGDMLFSNDVIDEDDMASDAGDKVPTQQSVKAYVDRDGWVDDGKVKVPATPADGIASDKITYKHGSLPSAAPALLRSKLEQILTFRDRGADYTGDSGNASSNVAKIQAVIDYAIANGDEIAAGRGDFVINDTLVQQGGTLRLRGAGENNTIIRCNANVPSLLIDCNVPLIQYGSISDLRFHNGYNGTAGGNNNAAIKIDGNGNNANYISGQTFEHLSIVGGHLHGLWYANPGYHLSGDLHTTNFVLNKALFNTFSGVQNGIYFDDGTAGHSMWMGNLISASKRGGSDPAYCMKLGGGSTITGGLGVGDTSIVMNHFMTGGVRIVGPTGAAEYRSRMQIQLNQFETAADMDPLYVSNMGPGLEVYPNVYTGGSTPRFVNCREYAFDFQPQESRYGVRQFSLANGSRTLGYIHMEDASDKYGWNVEVVLSGKSSSGNPFAIRRNFAVTWSAGVGTVLADDQFNSASAPLSVNLQVSGTVCSVVATVTVGPVNIFGTVHVDGDRHRWQHIPL